MVDITSYIYMAEYKAHTFVLRSLHLPHAWAVRCRTGGSGTFMLLVPVATVWQRLDGADSNFEDSVAEEEECAPLSGG